MNTPPSQALLAAMRQAAAQPSPMPASPPDGTPPPGWDEANELAGAAGAGYIPAPGPDTEPYGGAAKPGSLTATPTQYVAESGNLEARQANTNNAIAANEERGYNEAADIHTAEAAAKQKQAADYQQFRAEADARLEEDHQRHVDAYADYAKRAGSLKDPSEQFWEDKGTGARMLSGLAGFASGMGAGLTGAGGNPYLDYLNKQIGNNYAAHKQNISDLFDKQVAAGKIADTDANWTRFQDEAKLKYYDLATQHTQSLLKAQEQRALGSNVKQLANRTNQGLEQAQIDRRKALADAQAKAAAAAAGAAAARAAARQKEIDERFAKFYGEQDKDESPEQRTQAAFDALSKLPSIKDEDLARVSRSVGAIPNGQGGWALPKISQTHLDRKERDKQYEVQNTVDAATKTISEYLKDPDVLGSSKGFWSGAANTVQGAAPSFAQSHDTQAEVSKMNTVGAEMLGIIGKVAKDADGKPNKVMIEEFKDRFTPKIGDPPNVRAQKLKGGLDYIQKVAQTQAPNLTIPGEEKPAATAAPAAGAPLPRKADWSAFGGVQTGSR